MKIGLASDHAGFELKNLVKAFLSAQGYELHDYGALTYNPEDDYPDCIAPLAVAVKDREIEKGIAICGSGVGAAIVANKVPGVRAALIMDTYSAHQGVEHDDMNILCIGSRVAGDELAKELVITFLNAKYSHEARHQRRLEKVLKLEQQYSKTIS